MSKVRNKGFTLLEVMLAVTILAVGLMLILRSYTTSLQAIKISQNLVTANLLLEEKIWQKQEEQLRSGEVTVEQEQGEFAAPFEDFSYEISFVEQEDLPAEYEGRLYKSDFRVSWQQRKTEQDTSCVTLLRSK